MVYARRQKRKRYSRTKRSKRRSRRRAKKRQQLLSVKTVEKIAKGVVHKENETFNWLQKFTTLQAYPNSLTTLTDGDQLLHRGGCTDVVGNLLQHWGPQIILEDQYHDDDAFGNGYRKGESIYLKGVLVKGYMNIEPGTLAVGPIVEFFCLTTAPLRNGEANLVDNIRDIRVEPTNMLSQQKDNENGMLYKTEMKKTWSFAKNDAVLAPRIIPINFFIKFKKKIKYLDTCVPGQAVTQTDLMSRPIFLKWRALNVPEGSAPMTRDAYPQLNVSYRWFYTDS